MWSLAILVLQVAICWNLGLVDLITFSLQRQNRLNIKDREFFRLSLQYSKPNIGKQLKDLKTQAPTELQKNSLL